MSDPFGLDDVAYDPGEAAALDDYMASLRHLCTWDPRPYAGRPIGMLHCPECGCMVIAGVAHPPCDPDFCGSAP